VLTVGNYYAGNNHAVLLASNAACEAGAVGQ